MDRYSLWKLASMADLAYVSFLFKYVVAFPFHTSSFSWKSILHSPPSATQNFLPKALLSRQFLNFCYHTHQALNKANNSGSVVCKTPSHLPLNYCRHAKMNRVVYPPQQEPYMAPETQAAVEVRGFTAINSTPSLQFPVISCPPQQEPDEDREAREKVGIRGPTVIIGCPSLKLAAISRPYAPGGPYRSRTSSSCPTTLPSAPDVILRPDQLVLPPISYVLNGDADVPPTTGPAPAPPGSEWPEGPTLDQMDFEISPYGDRMGRDHVDSLDAGSTSRWSYWYLGGVRSRLCEWAPEPPCAMKRTLALVSREGLEGFLIWAGREPY